MQIGQAGVCRVMAELILRGHAPCVPAIDVGYDLVIENGVRLQVKTGTIRKVNNTSGPAYKFVLTQSQKIIRNGKEGSVGINRVWSDVCDFVILHGVTENRYWIIPAAMMDGCSSVFAPGLNTPCRKDYTETEAIKMRADLASGKSTEEVAALWGVGVGIINRVRRGEKICPAEGERSDRGRQIRKLENRWDLLDDFIRTVKHPTDHVEAAEAVLKLVT